MHNWQLDLKTLKYKNINITKKKTKFIIENDNLKIYTTSNQADLNESLKEKITTENNKKDIELRYLSHASTQILHDNLSILTDPWFFGPAFSNGWWLKKPPTFNVMKIIKETNLIYISHNHPDHLHLETLSEFDKNINIITPNFKSKSTYKLLKRLGFKNINLCEFNKVYKVTDKNIYFTMFKSGDFKEDSGIYFNINNKKILFNVDSNNLNGGTLPENIDILLSSYAGGASGFPLCFEDYTVKEKNFLLTRNKNAQFAMVLQLIKKTKCKIFMPYAGYFSESAKRDKSILRNNKKNKFEELQQYVKKRKINVRLIDFEKKDTIKIIKSSDKITLLKKNNQKPIYCLNNKYISMYINSTKKKYLNLNYEKKIFDYFKKSKFRSNLCLFIVLTKDNFETQKDNYIIDFEKNNFFIKKLSYNKIDNLFNKHSSNTRKRFLMIKIREESLKKTIDEKLRWEDLLIGFQCKIKRKPNIYNNDFWSYFTNEYIDSPNYRYESPCNQCFTLLQNKY